GWLHDWFMGMYMVLMQGEFGAFRARTQHARLSKNRKRAGRSRPAEERAELWRRRRNGRPICRMIPFLATCIALAARGGDLLDVNQHTAWLEKAKADVNELVAGVEIKRVRKCHWKLALRLFVAVAE